jgi:hypothetical protein
VNRLAEPFRMSLPTVSKHLEALARAGFVGIVPDGRLLLDCRTLAGAEVDGVAHVVSAARG